MKGFGDFGKYTSKRILNELETVYLRLRKIEVTGEIEVEGVHHTVTHRIY